MEIVAKYLCVIPCEDQDWEREYVMYEPARLMAALNAGCVRDLENGCIMCDYRMEDEE